MAGWVPELFAAQVMRTPDAVAVVADGHETSYRELDGLASRVAVRLRQLGVGTDTVVALHVERSLDMLVGLLGILRSGGAYLPIDPALPPARVAAILASARPPVIISHRDLARHLPPGDAVVLNLDVEPLAEADPPRDLPPAHPDALAYVIYTSGSTGTPKGIMVTHRALLERVVAKRDLYGLGAGDRMLQFTTLAFDAAGAEIYPALLSGAALVLHTDSARTAPADLLADCARLGVTAVMLAPAYLSMMVDGLSGSHKALSGLRLIVTGGEAIPAARLADLARMVPHRPRFLYAYGPTEATISATMFEVPMDPEVIEALGTMPIGEPLPGTGVYLLDEALQPVPDGEHGELCLTGAGLARGYLGDPAQTAASFVPSPFTGPGVRMYRTGDLARMRADGLLEFGGRRDDQVKIRGYRVSLGDVEAALARYPAVATAVVVVRDGRLAAYCRPSSGSAVTAGELRAHIRAQLPEYMLPSSITMLDQLPFTPGGKIDRGALPSPAEVAEQTGPELATTPIERTVADIWCRLLGRDRVGREQNFFEVGGDSLLALQLVARIGDQLGASLSLGDVFAAPTVAQLAALASESMMARVGDDELLSMLDDLEEDTREPLWPN